MCVLGEIFSLAFKYGGPRAASFTWLLIQVSCKNEAEVNTEFQRLALLIHGKLPKIGNSPQIYSD